MNRGVSGPLNVIIEIKPGSKRNCLNINSHGVIPVAILGSEDFDASLINPETLLFGGLKVRIRGKKRPLCSITYSDEDIYQDMVCHFEDDASNWEVGNGVATLTGNLFDGTPFEGSDSICVVSNKKRCNRSRSQTGTKVSVLTLGREQFFSGYLPPSIHCLYNFRIEF